MDQFKGKMNHPQQMKYQKDPKKHSYYKKEPKGKQNSNPLNLHTGSPGMKQPYGKYGGYNSNPKLYDQHKQNLFNMCQKHHLYLIQVETTDGQLFEGIVDEFDEDGVTLIVPCGEDDRGDGYDDYGYGPGPAPGVGYGFGPGFGSPYGYGYPRRFRRFRRFRYPFFNLNRIFFPFFF